MKDLSILKETILSNVHLGDVLKSRRIIHSVDHEEQFSCPFHGADKKKSARYYNDTDTAYCWVCKEKWDLFSFIAKQENVNFVQALNIIINRYNIDISKVPESTEGAVKRIIEKRKVSIDQKKIYLEKLKQAIYAIRDDISLDKYNKIVFAYFLLKYQTSDEDFENAVLSLKDAILKLIKSTEVVNG